MSMTVSSTVTSAQHEWRGAYTTIINKNTRIVVSGAPSGRRVPGGGGEGPQQ